MIMSTTPRTVGPSLLRVTVSENAFPFIAEADGAQVLVMDGGGGSGAGAARGDDYNWGDTDVAGRCGLCLLTAVVGVCVVVIEGGDAVTAVKVACPAGRPHLIWTAGR